MTKGLLKDSVVLTFYSMITNIINYCYQIIASRVFQIEDYGLLNTLFAVSTIVTIPCVALGPVISKHIVELSVRNEKEELSEVFTHILIDMVVISLILLIISLASINIVSEFLKISDDKILILLYGYSFLSYIVFSIGCIAHSMRMYFLYSLTSMISAVVRITGITIIIITGINDERKLLVSMASMLIGAIIDIPVLAIIIKKSNIKILYKKLRQTAFKRQIFTFQIVSGMFVVSLCGTIMSNAVMIYIRAFFHDELSGLVSISMQFGNILMLTISSLTAASYPHMVKSNELNNKALGIYAQSVLLCVVCSVVYFIAVHLFSGKIIVLLFSEKYIEAQTYIPYTVMIALFSVLNSLNISYAIVKNKIRVLVATYITGMAMYFAAGLLFKNDADKMLLGFAVTMMAIYVVNLLYILFSYFKSGGDGSGYGRIKTS